MNEIRPLTALRGIFACWVMLLHIRIEALQELPDPLFIIRRGYLAVDFFFVLSGYILAATYGARFWRPDLWAQYRRFVIRRFGRLFPLHTVVVLVVVAVLPVYPLRLIIAELTLTHRWHLWPPSEIDWIDGPAWSISTEWAANLAFPLFVWTCLSRSTLLAAASAVGSIGLIVFCASQHHWNLNIFTSWTILPMLRCIGGFGLGMLAYRWRDAVPALGRDPALLVLGAAYLVNLLLRGSDLLMVAITVPAIVGLARSTGWVARLLSSGVANWLGEISYSIYLVHSPVARSLAGLLPGSATDPYLFALYVGGTIVITLAVSTATYRWIEEPARLWAKRLSDHRASRDIDLPPDGVAVLPAGNEA